MTTAGWWISPEGDMIEVPEHFEAVRAAPGAFGFAEKEAAGWTRDDRERVLREAIGKGWIRVRGHRQYTTFEMDRWTEAHAVAVKSFLEHTGAWPQEAVEIHELGPKRQWRERAEYFLEERFAADPLLGNPSPQGPPGGIPPDLERVVLDPGYLARQGFVPKGCPTVWTTRGRAEMGAKVLRTVRAAQDRPRAQAAILVGLRAGFGKDESFEAEAVREEAMRHFPAGGTLVLQLGWFEGTREDSARLSFENAGPGLSETDFRKAIDALARRLVRKFRQRTVWVDYFAGGEPVEAVSFDWTP